MMRENRVVLLMLMLGTQLAATESKSIPSGLYVLAWQGEGWVVDRADTEGQVVLQKQLTPALRDVKMVSASNDNSLFRMTAIAGPIAEGTERQPLALVVAGRCMPVSGISGRGADGCVSVETSIAGREAADQVAGELKITPRLRTHPGYQLLTTVTPKKGEYRPREAVTLVMTIRNVGKTTICFDDGGSQRGARNNQFGFTAFGNGGTGPAVPDVGDASNLGGKVTFVTLAPGEAFTKEVDLSRWFRFDTPDSYKVTAIFALPIREGITHDLSIDWEDSVVGTCAVRVAAKPAASSRPAGSAD